MTQNQELGDAQSLDEKCAIWSHGMGVFRKKYSGGIFRRNARKSGKSVKEGLAMNSKLCKVHSIWCTGSAPEKKMQELNAEVNVTLSNSWFGESQHNFDLISSLLITGGPHDEIGSSCDFWGSPWRLQQSDNYWNNCASRIQKIGGDTGQMYVKFKQHFGEQNDN